MPTPLFQLSSGCLGISCGISVFREQVGRVVEPLDSMFTIDRGSSNCSPSRQAWGRERLRERASDCVSALVIRDPYEQVKRRRQTQDYALAERLCSKRYFVLGE